MTVYRDEEEIGAVLFSAETDKSFGMNVVAEIIWENASPGVDREHVFFHTPAGVLRSSGIRAGRYRRNFQLPAGTGLSVGTALIRGSVLRESAFRRLSNRGRERRNRDFSGMTAGPAGLSGEGLVVQIRVTRPFR